MDLTPTKDQEAALVMAARLKEFNDAKGPRLAVLAGYAGTGKTTLIKKLREVWGGYPIVVAPTGKAALRVKEATGMFARTIHSWLYDPEEDETSGEVRFLRKAATEIEVGEVPVLVIDEASMVGPELWEDIFDTCVMMRMNVLIVGDPFQLPPVQKNRDENGFTQEFNLLSEHFLYHDRVLMKEIVRQALDNPIIRASMLVREGDAAEAVFQLPRIRPTEVIEKGTEIMRRGSGVIIVHKNETRNKMNVAIRKGLGRPDHEIVSGEPLLILQNNYVINRFNGEIAVFKEWIEAPKNEHLVKDWIRKQEALTRFGVAQFETTDIDGHGQCVLATEQVFGRMGHIADPPIVKLARVVMGGGRSAIPTPEEAAQMTPAELQRALGHPFVHANFGYVMTCHKSQGSEWGTVLTVIEPSLRLNGLDGKRWLYTAITRARENILLSLGVRV